MKNNRITINLNKFEGFDAQDLAQLYQESNNKLNLVIVEEYPTNFDSEKGYQESRVIFHDKEMNTYFEGQVTNWGCGDYEYETILTEVFPREITKTIYE